MTFFGFPKIKCLDLTGLVDKPVRFSCQIFLGFNVPKILNLVNFDRVIQKGGRFGGHSVHKILCDVLVVVVVVVVFLRFLGD